MAGNGIKLPPGFELDTNLPEGFVLDKPVPVGPSRDIPTGMRGALEATGSLATAAVAGPLSGYAGIAGSILPGPQGQGADWQEKTQDALTYHPRTDMGRRITDTAAYPFEKLAELGNLAGEATTDFSMRSRTSPEVAGGLGAGVNATIQALPMLVAKGSKAPAAKALETAKLKAVLPAGAEEATAAGYRLTPTQLEAGVVKRALEGLSGSAKMEKLASLKNQKVTNEIISGDIGIPKGKQITAESLEASRIPDYQAYENVKGSVKLIKPDNQFKSDLMALRGDFTNAANAYPDLMKNDAIETLIKSLNTTASPRSMVELTRKLRKDATANLKAFDDPTKQALGMAQRNASAALENLIDRALTSVGKNDLVSEWKKSRSHLAKTYDVEAALNETTGDVSARYLAKLYGKKKPLTGGLKTTAEAAQAFEGSFRDPAKMRDASEFSYGDLLLGGVSGLGAHLSTGGASSAAGLGAVLARPVARHLLLSRGAQVGEPGLMARTMEFSTRNPALFAIAPSVGLRDSTGEETTKLAAGLAREARAKRK